MIKLNDYLYKGDTVFKILQRYTDDLKEEVKVTGTATASGTFQITTTCQSGIPQNILTANDKNAHRYLDMKAEDKKKEESTTQINLGRKTQEEKVQVKDELDQLLVDDEPQKAPVKRQEPTQIKDSFFINRNTNYGNDVKNNFFGPDTKKLTDVKAKKKAGLFM